MKKIIMSLLLLCGAVIVTSCEPEEENFGEKLLLDHHGKTRIKQVYRNIIFVSDTFIPFKCCVFTFADGSHKYAQNIRIHGAVDTDYVVKEYFTYKACPDEIYKITMDSPQQTFVAPKVSWVTSSSRGLITSPFYEGEIVEAFTMKCRFTTFLIMGLPIITQFNTQFLELADGKLIYIKDYNADGRLYKAGEKIRYKTYTLNPNEAIKIE